MTYCVANGYEWRAEYVWIELRYLLASRSAASESKQPGFRRAKACIVLFMLGARRNMRHGIRSHLHPIEIRGPLGAISQRRLVCKLVKLMPRTAKLTDRICSAQRAMSTMITRTPRVVTGMLTGRPHAPTNSENATPGANQ